LDPRIRDGFVGAVGNTPLIRLRGASQLTGCNILGKAEFLKPGGLGEGPRRALHHPRRGESAVPSSPAA